MELAAVHAAAVVVLKVTSAVPPNCEAVTVAAEFREVDPASVSPLILCFVENGVSGLFSHIAWEMQESAYKTAVAACRVKNFHGTTKYS